MCAAGLSTGSAETRKAFHFAPTDDNISAGPYSSTGVAKPVPAGVSYNKFLAKLASNMRWKALGREPNADDVEAATWAVYQRGLKVSGVE